MAIDRTWPEPVARAGEPELLFDSPGS